MNATRRKIVGGAIAALIAKPLRAQSGKSMKSIRIGVLTDLSGTYRDISGPTGIACVRQAVQEFTASKGIDVEVLTADFQEKPDVGAAIARQWFDQDGVDAIVDLTNSAVALAVSNVAREKNKVALVTGAAVSAVTGKQCSPNTVHWTYDTWMLAHSTGIKTLQAGGKTWFLIAPDYAFGHSLAGDTAQAVVAGGGAVLGSVMYPFPDTTDFSGLLAQAQGSGAQVLGLCNGGSDLVNSLKQANEFRLHRKMRVAGLLMFTQIVTCGRTAHSPGAVSDRNLLLGPERSDAGVHGPHSAKNPRQLAQHDPGWRLRRHPALPQGSRRHGRRGSEG